MFCFQIKTLQNLIDLTKQQLERLNAEFGSERHPPAIYLQVCKQLNIQHKPIDQYFWDLIWKMNWLNNSVVSEKKCMDFCRKLTICGLFILTLYVFAQILNFGIFLHCGVSKFAIMNKPVRWFVYFHKWCPEEFS